MKRTITAYHLKPGERDNGDKPVIHSFTPDEAAEIQEYLESGVACRPALLNRAAIAFAHASVIVIE